MEKPISLNLKGVLEILDSMIEAELAVAEMYRTCAQVWKHEQAFWTTLEKEESQHVRYIRQIMDIVSRKPDRFQKNPAFNVTAIRHTTEYVRQNTDKVRQGKILEHDVLFIARDIEHSVIECKYNEAVKTDDVEYMTLSRLISQETHNHRSRIDRKIAGGHQ